MHLPEVTLGHAYWTQHFFASALLTVLYTVGWVPWKCSLHLLNRGKKRGKGVELSYAGGRWVGKVVFCILSLLT